MPGSRGLQAAWSPPKAAEPYLRRLDLADPDGLKEILMQKAVVAGLVAGGVIDPG
jgi:hypothetical protein